MATLRCNFQKHHIVMYIFVVLSGRKYQRRVWTEDEKRVVLKEFRREIALNQLPGKTAIDRVMEKYSCFDGRKWTNIKDFIRNHSGRANKKWY